MTFFPINQRLSESPYPISDLFPFHINIASVKSHYPAHRHDYLELSFVIEGTGYQLINGKKYPMIPGTCCFIMPYQIHELFSETPRLRLYNCMFDPNFLTPSSSGHLGLNDLLFAKEDWVPSVQVGGIQCELMIAMAQNMLDEFKTDGPWRIELIRSKLSEFLIHFDRLRRQAGSKLNAISSSRHNSIWPIVHYVHTNYGKLITLSSLAEHFGVNRSHLSAEFTKHLGINFVRFLHEVRIRHARSLLISTEMGIFDIALEVGFGSFKSFSRCFRELNGIAPSQYRKRYHTKG